MTMPSPFDRSTIAFCLIMLIVLVSACFLQANILYEYHPDSLSVARDFPSKKKQLRISPVLDSTRAMVFDLSKGAFSAQQKLPLIPLSCFRFDFTFAGLEPRDSVTVEEPDSLWNFPLMSFISAVPTDNSSAEEFFRFRIIRSNDEWVLAYEIFRPGNREGFFKRAAVLDPNTPYCLGFRVGLGQDSVAQEVEFTVNGISALEVDVSEYGYKIRNTIIRFGGPGWQGRFGGLFYINDIAYGDSWLGHRPRKPALPDSTASGQFTATEALLISPLYKTFIVPAPHWASQYQIMEAGKTPIVPLYDSGLDTVNRDSIRAPLLLDTSKVYLWRIRYASSDENISEWSAPETLLFSRAPLHEIVSVSVESRPVISQFGLRRILLSAGISMAIALGLIFLFRRKRK